MRADADDQEDDADEAAAAGYCGAGAEEVAEHGGGAHDQAEEPERGAVQGETLATGGILGDRGPLTNWVILKQPVDPAEIIADVGRRFPGRAPYLFVSAWPTPDLRPHGLSLAGHPPLMLRLPTTTTAPPPTDLEIRQVTDASGLADAEHVLVEGYPLPELQPFQPGAVYDVSFLEGSTVWVGYDGDVPLATSTAHNAAGLTIVENVEVMPAARGRAAGAAITWAATTPTNPRP